MGKPTAQDVAKACDTSLSAVSRAFRAGGSISPQLRAEILRTAKALGYVPPPQRARRMGRVVSFALIVGDIENTFYPMVLRQFSFAAERLGWDMTVFVAPERGSVDSLMSQVIRADVDAVVITSAELSSTLAAACRDRALPVILFNRIQVDADMTAVCTDNYGGGQLAAARLLSKGRRNIAYIGGRKGTSTHLERRRGFLDGLQRLDVGLTHDLLCNYDYNEALDVGRGLFGRTSPPDGIFCANDHMGFALIDAAIGAGVTPGQDVSIIGYDDVPVAGWSRYSLTTISQQVPMMVDRTVEGIRRLVDGEEPSGQIDVVPAVLIERDSG